jgi:hypothetical protein
MAFFSYGLTICNNMREWLVLVITWEGKTNMKFRDILLIIRYQFDDILATQHSLKVARQIWQSHHYWHYKKNPQTVQRWGKNTQSHFCDVLSLLFLWGRQNCVKVSDNVDCRKLEAFVIMGQNWVTNIVKPCNLYRIIMTVVLLIYWNTMCSCISCLMMLWLWIINYKRYRRNGRGLCKVSF